MIVSPDILRRDMVKLLTQIDAQIKEVEEVAAEAGIEAHEVRDANGGWAMSPLLLAKIQALGALVQLNEQGKKP